MAGRRHSSARWRSCYLCFSDLEPPLLLWLCCSLSDWHNHDGLKCSTGQVREMFLYHLAWLKSSWSSAQRCYTYTITVKRFYLAALSFLPTQVQCSMDHLLHYGFGNPPALEFLHDGHNGMLVESLPEVINHQYHMTETDEEPCWWSSE